MNSSFLLRSAIIDSCDGLRTDVLVLNRLGSFTCRPDSKVRILVPEEVEAPQHIAGRRLSQQSRAQTLLRDLYPAHLRRALASSYGAVQRVTVATCSVSCYPSEAQSVSAIKVVSLLYTGTAVRSTRLKPA